MCELKAESGCAFVLTLPLLPGSLLRPAASAGSRYRSLERVNPTFSARRAQGEIAIQMRGVSDAA